MIFDDLSHGDFDFFFMDRPETLRGRACLVHFEYHNDRKQNIEAREAAKGQTYKIICKIRPHANFQVILSIRKKYITLKISHFFRIQNAKILDPHLKLF